MDIIKCKKCGYELFPLDRVCDRCGTPVGAGADFVKNGNAKASRPIQVNQASRYMENMQNANVAAKARSVKPMQAVIAQEPVSMPQQKSNPLEGVIDFFGSIVGKITLGVAVTVLVGVIILEVVLAARGYRTILVEALNGVTTVANDGKEKEAHKGQKLKSGDNVNVTNDSDLTMSLDKTKYVYAEADTRFRIVAMGKKKDSKTVIKLAEGSTLYNIEKLNSNETFDVDTPNATMAVRGTIFHVLADRYETLLQVFDGEVYVELLDEGGNRTGESMSVGAGESVKIRTENNKTAFVTDGEDTKRRADKSVLSDGAQSFIGNAISNRSDRNSVKDVDNKDALNIEGPELQNSELDQYQYAGDEAFITKWKDVADALQKTQAKYFKRADKKSDNRPKTVTKKSFRKPDGTKGYYFEASGDDYSAPRNIASINNSKGEMHAPVYLWVEGDTCFYYTEAKLINVSDVMDLSGFTLQEIELSDFKIKKVSFSGCESLKNIKLSNVEVSEGISFSGCTSLESIDLTGLDTSNSTSMSGMFSGCTSLKSIDLSVLDTSNSTSMGGMFSDCTSLKSVDLSVLDTSNVTGMGYMFSGCTSLESIDLSGVDVGAVDSMADMFKNCTSLQSVNLSGLNSHNVTDMTEMFKGCTSLISVDLAGIDVSNVGNMTEMFSGCTSLESIDLNALNSRKASEMRAMFYACKSLRSIDLSGLDKFDGYYRNLEYMFAECSALESADMSMWDSDFRPDNGGMFENCTSLQFVDMSYCHDGKCNPADCRIPYTATVYVSRDSYDILRKDKYFYERYPYEGMVEIK